MKLATPDLNETYVISRHGVDYKMSYCLECLQEIRKAQASTDARWWHVESGGRECQQ